MKKFKVILDFLGAQDGVTVTQFRAGEIVDISDYLAPHISDWAEPYEEVAGEIVDISDYLAPHISDWAEPYEEVAVESSAPAPAEPSRPQLKAKRGA